MKKKTDQRKEVPGGSLSQYGAAIAYHGDWVARHCRTFEKDKGNVVALLDSIEAVRDFCTALMTKLSNGGE